ncbi:uncharacterized protein K452DRAFT_315120 [Aplosporella prunicola CBS 121167]|uniref:Uncharacterized protein n=1 Tax=Aplosporella prunicola CBS 121167 TaxID=1176127 RepID=A0A6A6BS46_9PEZI|nr:uncharacterized protein K452DRAFT_315120 [Aplosporella prunicola CBS 121167]KAF2146922.1 hypothetical protein K452DRAFT_315120 [Aplosporella prunicola CBS 121167]
MSTLPTCQDQVFMHHCAGGGSHFFSSSLVSVWQRNTLLDYGSWSSNVPEKAFVVASQKGDNTSWFAEQFPDWARYIYVVDDATASLTVPANKGREAMVDLTYTITLGILTPLPFPSFLIDNYDALPNSMLFLHAQRYQWYNDDPDYDGAYSCRTCAAPGCSAVAAGNGAGGRDQWPLARV